MYFQNEIKRRKLWYLCAIAFALGITSSIVALILLKSIDLFTNIFFFGKLSLKHAQPSSEIFGNLIIFFPIIGGVIAGLMARYGSPGIRGHGIPEAMEVILTKASRIPKKMMWLKPLSSAIVIGSGGPFGAEGPIIATGGAFGSFFGQFMPKMSEHNRKTLLACGAAAGMTAIFGTPLSAIFITIELLLFEFSPKSFIPVAIAVSTAQALRFLFGFEEMVFAIEHSHFHIGNNMYFYFLCGLIAGAISCLISKSIFYIEDLFEKLPLHWMWWPAIGGLFVGIIGLIDINTMGVGYSNIINALNNKLTIYAATSLFALKFLSWALSLGSGTSGGTLAPILTLGSSLGLILGKIGIMLFPDLSISVSMCALVCMAAMFAGATRAILTSVVFAIEATGTPLGVAPLISGCSAAYLMSLLFLKETIMTEKITRRGIKVPQEYYPVKKEA